MKIKIISDGDMIDGTTVVDEEAGEVLEVKSLFLDHQGLKVELFVHNGEFPEQVVTSSVEMKDIPTTVVVIPLCDPKCEKHDHSRG